MSENKELQVVESQEQLVVGNPFKQENNFFFSSIVDDGSRESKVAIYNAMNDVDAKISDFVGETLEIVDVIAHSIDMLDEQTGEVIKSVRTVLVGKDGTNYQAVSGGVVSSLQKIFNIVGYPSWKDNPIKVIPREQRTRRGFRTLTLVLAV